MTRAAMTGWAAALVAGGASLAEPPALDPSAPHAHARPLSADFGVPAPLAGGPATHAAGADLFPLRRLSVRRPGEPRRYAVVSSHVPADVAPPRRAAPIAVIVEADLDRGRGRRAGRRPDR